MLVEHEPEQAVHVAVLGLGLVKPNDVRVEHKCPSGARKLKGVLFRAGGHDLDVVVVS
jgi:hypothetical protein